MSYIMALDPGLDATGLAVFDLDRFEELRRREPDLLAALRSLHHSHTIETAPRSPLPERLALLSATLGGVVESRAPQLVYVEVPQVSGEYARHDTQIRSRLDRLYMAIGAVLAGVQVAVPIGGRVVTVTPGTEKKEFRHKLLLATAKKTRLELPKGPRGGKREDEWDAVFLGWHCLQHRIHADLSGRAA